MAVAVSALAILPFPFLLSRNHWIPFRREKVSERHFSFQNGNVSFCFQHGAKRRRRKSAVEDLNRGYRCAASGVVCLSRRRYSSRRSRAVGPDETRPQAGLEHASCASIQKGPVRGVSRFFGLWPLVGGDNESKASCGVIRGSNGPWFDCKERDP
jgi:hypothetical protein